MISRNEFNRLEKRINAALLSGAASQRELQFLYSISITIDKFGRNTRLSDHQAECLFEILDRVERRLWADQFTGSARIIHRVDP
jgi:hypothetical protein